ncbi:MAG: hypothetical protein HY437_02185 [Candidatus Magasanikbacteria bacterium]|nr:hypothetical protein [Candidatus Magasanikbacteria bacterium]
MKEFFDCQRDWLGAYNTLATDRRRRILDRCGRGRRRTLALMLREIRHGRQHLINLYLSPFADQLEHESRVWNTTDLGRLIQLAAQPGTDPLDQQRRHEALRFFDETRALAHIEEREPLEWLRNHFENFINMLARELFEPGSERLPVYTYHERADHYRVRAYAFMDPLPHQEYGDLLERRNRPTSCRLYRMGGALHFVALRDRIKEHFDAWLKMQKQVAKGRPHPYVIHDRCGVQFIAPTVEVAHAIFLKTRELVEKTRRGTPGIVKEVIDTLTTDEPTENQHSSRFFRAIRMRIIWQGVPIEVQITTFPHYYSSILAVDTENHDLYRLRQCFGSYFPFLFPTNIYGIDWTDERLRQQLMALRIAQLGWRVDRETLPIADPSNG